MKFYRARDMNPIEDGIRRAEVEEAKLKRLIAHAEQVESSSAKSRVAWRRQADLVHSIKDRLEKQRHELSF